MRTMNTWNKLKTTIRWGSRTKSVEALRELPDEELTARLCELNNGKSNPLKADSQSCSHVVKRYNSPESIEDALRRGELRNSLDGIPDENFAKLLVLATCFAFGVVVVFFAIWKSFN